MRKNASCSSGNLVTEMSDDAHWLDIMLFKAFLRKNTKGRGRREGEGRNIFRRLVLSIMLKFLVLVYPKQYIIIG